MVVQTIREQLKNLNDFPKLMAELEGQEEALEAELEGQEEALEDINDNIIRFYQP
ncbi:hypothetical protein F2Q68_00000316 [Brassica cretica]|uniref:Uncharacterized protein n=1 Tax=Brassica cretica TaxID=69181 RepID=A0A8S9J9G1_BRACR|nr:hypothetical protein F2Q68_00000316 [Brassica cretica]